MDSNKSKELKIKSFRVDEDTFEKFKQIASNEFGNQGQCLDALINLYEMENSKTALIERKMEIDSFQEYLNKINQLFITSLQMSKDAEGRVKDEFIRQISIKDTTIERLHIREKENLAKANEYKGSFIELESKIKHLEDSNKALELDKTTLSQLVSRNHEVLEQNKKEIERLEKYKNYKEENVNLSKVLIETKNELQNIERDNKEKNLELEIANKQISYLESRVEEGRKELESYREIIEAIRKEHRRELDILESKYSKMVQNEGERLLRGFNDELRIEKKTMELTIKTLEQEKRNLELQLANLK